MFKNDTCKQFLSFSNNISRQRREYKVSDVAEKIKEILKDPQLASLATVTEDGKPWVRYVMVHADENLNLRTATFLGSRKVNHIKKNADVHLTCGVSSLQEMKPYLQIQARGEISTDSEEKKAFWNDGLKAYFSGPDDPNFAILKSVPYRIELQDMTSMEPKVWEP